jgi:hypothetical protein
MTDDTKRSLTQPSATGVRPGVNKFLETIKAKNAAKSARLIFGIDATASRQETWDLAAALTSTMLAEAKGVDLQLAYYRGFDECEVSSWVRDPAHQSRMMGKVLVQGGATQIERILDHALKETANLPVAALVFIGDCMEEDLDRLTLKARELGKRKVPIFAFLEGADVVAEISFKELATASGGAFAKFDTNASKQLGELLKAAMAYASGGLEALATRKDLKSTLLLEQLKPKS